MLVKPFTTRVVAFAALFSACVLADDGYDPNSKELIGTEAVVHAPKTTDGWIIVTRLSETVVIAPGPNGDYTFSASLINTADFYVQDNSTTCNYWMSEEGWKAQYKGARLVDQGSLHVTSDAGDIDLRVGCYRDISCEARLYCCNREAKFQIKDDGTGQPGSWTNVTVAAYNGPPVSG